MKEYKHIWALLEHQPWLITGPALDEIIAIVERHMAGSVDLEAVAARYGKPLENTNRTELRGSTAVIDIGGPIFRYSNLFTAFSGASSVEAIGLDLQAALDSPQVKQILLNVDSPGGQVQGIHELAARIREAAAVKPVTAYVGGYGASAAYFLAAAASRIVATKTAFLGSIGVVAAIRDRRAADEKAGIKTHEIVSSQSPRKRVDPATADGRAEILQNIDALAQIFIDDVAKYRGTTSEKVIETYGQGGTLIADDALKAGAIDAIGTYEGTLADLNPQPKGITYVADTNQPPAAEGPSEQTIKTRIQQILTCEEATGRTELAQHLAFQTSCTTEEAKAILKAAPAAARPTEPPPNPLHAAMTKIGNPNVGTGTGGAQEASVEETASSILRFVPAHRRVKAS